MSAFRLQQLRAILWKAWIIRRRHYITLVFELIVPLTLVLLLSFGLSTPNDRDLRKDINDVRLTKDPGQEDQQDKDGYIPVTIFPYPVFEIRRAVIYLPSLKHVVYTPNNDDTKRIVNEVNRIFKKQMLTPSIQSNRRPTHVSDFQLNFTGVDSERDIELMWQEENNSEDEAAAFGLKLVGIVFNAVSSNFSGKGNSSRYHYTIRMSSNIVGSTSRKYAWKYEAGPETNSPYSRQERTSFFLSLQVLLNEAYLNLKASDLGVKREAVDDLSIYAIPYPKYRTSPKASLADLVPTIIVIGFVVSFPVMAKRITDEKNNRSREMFRMMGLSDWIYWIGNFIHNWIFFFVVALVVLTLLFYPLPGSSSHPNFFNYSSYGPLVLLILIYTANTVLFGFLITIPCKTPILSVVAAVVAWVVSLIPANMMNANVSHTSNANRLWSCLLPNTALSWALRVVGQKEVSGEGLHFYNINDETPIYESMTFLWILIMMLVSCLAISFLIWYLDNVWPFQPGVPKYPWFLFTKNYWFKRGSQETVGRDKGALQDPRFFEAGDDTKPVAIRLCNVTKKFGGKLSKRKLAVNNLSFDIYKDQLTCLLGHNGAGKTTTMSMITGMFPPSKGTIIVNGFDLVSQTQEARKSMALCPQHNPLYSELTVREHLILYARIKGFPENLLHEEVEKTIREITLTGHEDKVAPKLSGGMMRKLCLGIALVAGTKVVILDEPTSGLDVEVRRSIWDVLREARKTRTILLSTHDMEEADALSDRIVIMSEGHVTCSGSTMFLKRAFGAGYSLRIAKSDHFSQEMTQELIRVFFPESKIKSNVGSEISFSLESSSNVTDSKRLPNFFKELERKKNSLGIDSFGLSITTMEEVFLRSEDMAALEPLDASNDLRKSVSSNEMTQLLSGAKDVDRERLKGWPLTMQRVKGLFFKRVHFNKRYWKMAIFQIVIPGILFINWFLVSRSIFKQIKPDPPLDLKMKQIYDKTNVFYQTNATPEFFGQFYQPVVEKEGQNFKNLPVNSSAQYYLVNQTTKMSLADFTHKHLIGLEMNNNSNTGRRKFYGWSNNEAIHSMPLTIDMLYKALDFELTQDPTPNILTTNYPLPVSDETTQFIQAILIMDITWALLLPITVPFLAASYILFPIHERASKAKLIQIMTGLHRSLLHGVNFSFDFILHFIASIIIIGVFVAMDTQEFFTRRPSDIFSMFILLMLFGVVSIILAYIFSNIFSKQGSGFTFLVLIYLISGLVLSIVGVILRLLSSFDLSDSKDHETLISKETYNNWNWIFRISPIYSMVLGFRNIYSNGAKQGQCEKLALKFPLKTLCSLEPTPESFIFCCPDKCLKNVTNNCIVSSPLVFDDRGIGKELFMMLVTLLVSALVLFLMETNWSRFVSRFFSSSFVSRIFSSSPPECLDSDSDVTRERERIQTIVGNNSFSHEALVIDRLTKKFKKVFAVNGISVGVHQKECFGLLGVNGAGKTTTFRMITGDLFPTFGNAFQSTGRSVVKNTKEYQEQLGYCPQFDPLLDKLSGRETLQLFARLRGLQEKSIAPLVSQLIALTDLTAHADKKTESFSGGNKRKLSLAIALMANPQILLLDEPTSGVDPAARRRIWMTLSHISQTFGCSIILTSHSMQECEALCQRIAIMVSGKLRCLGSSQHLRAKFGQGYTIAVKFKRSKLTDAVYLESVRSHLEAGIPGVRFTDQHETLWTLRVPDPTVQWSTLFEVMQGTKDKFDLEDYSISDTTLEQIFVGFAREQQTVTRL